MEIISFIGIILGTIVIFGLSYLFLSKNKRGKYQKFQAIGKQRFTELFSIKEPLKSEMKNFFSKKTKIFLHLINIYNNDPKDLYNKIIINSAHQEFIINNIKKDSIISFDYEDKLYPYKSNINEEIVLLGKNNKKIIFIISIKKNSENHFNIILNETNELTFSLEIIYCSKNKDLFPEYLKIENEKIYSHEISNYKYLKRFNIVNIPKNYVSDIYSYGIENDEKMEEKNKFNRIVNTNLLFNFILFENKKAQSRRVFVNEKEKTLETFRDNEYDMINKFYKEVIYKHLDKNGLLNNNLTDFIQDFNKFENNYNYEDIFDKTTNEKYVISDLRNLNIKFNRTPFYILYYNKIELKEEILAFIEYLFYLHIIIKDYQNCIANINELIIFKNKFLNNDKELSNKDKVMILVSYMIQELDDNKINIALKKYYDLLEQSPYVQSELLFRKIISDLNENSSLYFIYLQLNSGCGVDLLSYTRYYKIKDIPLIGIKNHILNDHFCPYFFSYESFNKIIGTNICQTLIKSYNEKNKLGYRSSCTLGTTPNKDDTIKLLSLKFHEYVHSEFNKNLYAEISPIYVMDENFNIFDNEKKIKPKEELLYNEGELGKTVEYYIFQDVDAIRKIVKSEYNLSELNNIELYKQDNFSKLRRIYKRITEDIFLPTKLTNDIQKEIKQRNIPIPRINLKDKKILNESKFYELGIFEDY